ncbi:MAG: 50S ribosomal protein L17 [Candidatus Yanofskybacteria bacterium]|nr:50S ribosomal protein L17 [Candidatus Yanofskybacteria bacterium]
MRKRVTGKKFGRPRNQRLALLKGLARSFVDQERIQTTEAKAKETVRVVERLVTRAKRGDIAARRYLIQASDTKTAKKLVEEIAPRYKERAGGYTRVIKLGARPSDGAPMVILEFVK